MILKVVKYKNYGFVFRADEKKDNWEHKFYWSFYQLNNGEIIGLINTEYWDNKKLIDQEYSLSITKSDLLNGDTHNYKFGDAKANDDDEMSREFFEWFDSLPPFHKVKASSNPSLEEEKCVMGFYNKHVLDFKDKKTNTILT